MLKTDCFQELLKHFDSFYPGDMAQIIASGFGMDRTFETFIATGNVPLNTGQGLPQTQGLTIIVENLNRLRYLAHFRSVHRGSFFQELRTTDARQLQPDAWGFICNFQNFLSSELVPLSVFQNRSCSYTGWGSLWFTNPLKCVLQSCYRATKPFKST